MKTEGDEIEEIDLLPNIATHFQSQNLLLGRNVSASFNFFVPSLTLHQGIRTDVGRKKNLSETLLFDGY